MGGDPPARIQVVGLGHARQPVGAGGAGAAVAHRDVVRLVAAQEAAPVAREVLDVDAKEDDLAGVAGRAEEWARPRPRRARLASVARSSPRSSAFATAREGHCPSIISGRATPAGLPFAPRLARRPGVWP